MGGRARSPPALVGSRLRDAQLREDPSGVAYYTFSSTRTNHPPQYPTQYAPIIDTASLPSVAARLGVRPEHAHLLVPSMAEDLEFVARYGRQTWERLIGGRSREGRAQGEEVAPWFCLDLVRAFGVAGFRQGYLSTTPLDLLPGKSSRISIGTFLAMVPPGATQPEMDHLVILCDGQRSGFRFVSPEDFVSARLTLVQDSGSSTGYSRYLEIHGPADVWSSSFRVDACYLLEDLLGGPNSRGRLRPGHRVIQLVLEGLFSHFPNR